VEALKDAAPTDSLSSFPKSGSKTTPSDFMKSANAEMSAPTAEATPSIVARIPVSRLT
jgi:hypothetical protein